MALLFVIRIHTALSGIVLDRHTHTRARWHSQRAEGTVGRAPATGNGAGGMTIWLLVAIGSVA